MARGAASISDSYMQIAKPANPFTQVNFAPNKTEGVSSYDNAEVIEALAEVYTYAQQERSYLMPLFDQTPMTALFQKQDTFNKVNFVQKVEEAPYTPLYVPSGGTRSYSLLRFHQGIQISQTVEAIRRYSLTAKAQMQLSKALGRLYDMGVMWALLEAVLTNTSIAASDFQGVPTANVVAFPDSGKQAHGEVDSGAFVLADLTTAVFDDLALDFEDSDIDPHDLVFIGGPELRRSLRKIADFRNWEKTIAYVGNEQLRFLIWNGWRFVFLGPETKPYSLITGATKLGSNGKPSAAGVALKAGQTVSSMVVTDLSTLQWGLAAFATRMRQSERDDLSYTGQFYTEVGFGGMRIDDIKVKNVIYKHPTKIM